MCARVCVCVHACMCVCVCVCMWYMCVCVCVCVVCVCVYVVRVCVCVCVCVCVHKHIIGWWGLEISPVIIMMFLSLCRELLSSPCACFLPNWFPTLFSSGCPSTLTPPVSTPFLSLFQRHLTSFCPRSPIFFIFCPASIFTLGPL